MMIRQVLVAPVLAGLCATAFGGDPWIVFGHQVVSEPIELGDVIVVAGGILEIRDVGQPGVRFQGNLWALGDAVVEIEGSVIRFLSTYNGQYSLVAAEQSLVSVAECDYRPTEGVQHALISADDATLRLRDSDFGEVQLLSAGESVLEAGRLNGRFEVIVQHVSSMTLADIPRDAGAGDLWVWVEFPPGSAAVYTPPMPGWIESWSFPPVGSTGIDQTVELRRCQTLLWPMLVREGCDLTLRDIPEDNWVVVGLHLPTDSMVKGLVNGTTVSNGALELGDRAVKLENVSIDTWNLYPQEQARITVLDSVVGEILSMGHSKVWVYDSTVDGTGGFLGARDSSQIVAGSCTFTCTIEASQDSLIALHGCLALPQPHDPTGEHTRFGAFDEAVVFADQTPFLSTPALGGSGAIVITYIEDPPALPPPLGDPVSIIGTVGVFSLGGDPRLERWTLDVVPRSGIHQRTLASGLSNVEGGSIAVWEGADQRIDHQLRWRVVDNRGRVFIGRHWVRADAEGWRGP